MIHLQLNPAYEEYVSIEHLNLSLKNPGTSSHYLLVLEFIVTLNASQTPCSQHSITRDRPIINPFTIKAARSPCVRNALFMPLLQEISDIFFPSTYACPIISLPSSVAIQKRSHLLRFHVNVSIPSRNQRYQTGVDPGRGMLVGHEHQSTRSSKDIRGIFSFLVLASKA